MLYWAFLFLVAAMVVGFSTAAVAVAKVLFLVCLTLFIMTLATHLTRSTS
jgi:uncharacterized membrane protein YtjA (UPF0391 family)